jgi:hypothetical protein
MTPAALKPCEECMGSPVLGTAIMRGKLVYSLPKPARHHDVIREMAEAGIPTPIGGNGDVQGFMTRYGFRDRLLTAGLIGHEGLLTSEDLW